jgi:hypothetical protein
MSTRNLRQHLEIIGALDHPRLLGPRVQVGDWRLDCIEKRGVEGAKKTLLVILGSDGVISSFYW